MLLIPAIDLKNGHCVRLIQGEGDAETIYSDDPASMARSFEDAGAIRLHLVDLDGEYQGERSQSSQYSFNFKQHFNTGPVGWRVT